MKEMIRYGFILSVICFVAAGLLAGVQALTGKRIAAQALAEQEQSLKDVVPDAVSFEPVEDEQEILYYRALNEQGNPVGLAFKASAKGYSSTIETMVGALIDGTILNIAVLSHNETPGLGSRVAGDDFSAQFKDCKDLSKVQAITGATISSRAVIDSVAEKLKEVLGLIKNGK